MPATFQNDFTNWWLPTKPQRNELPLESINLCLKSKHLLSRTIWLIKNMCKTVCTIYVYCKQLWQPAFCPFINSQRIVYAVTRLWEFWPALHRIALVILRPLWRHDIWKPPLPTMTHNVTKVSTPSPSPLKRDVIYGRLITHAVCPHGCCPLTDWPWRWRQYDPSKRQKYFPKDTA
jgi:hypothetical protein